MIINGIEYKEKISEWCLACATGPQPNEKCKMCHVHRIISDHGTKIAAPTNWERRDK